MTIDPFRDYIQSCPVSPRNFSHLRWRRFTDYRHAAHLHLVPVSAPEVGKLVGTLPLVFARTGSDQPLVLCALTGLIPNTNHCLDERQQWQAGCVPAFLRDLAGHFRRTEQAVAALEKAGLLVAWPLQDHQGQPVSGLWLVNESAVQKLADQDFLPLRRNVALAVAYAQM